MQILRAYDSWLLFSNLSRFSAAAGRKAGLQGRRAQVLPTLGKRSTLRCYLLPILREKRRTPSSTDHPVKAGVGEGTMPCLKPAQPLSPRSRSALVSNLRSSSHPTMLSCSREILKQFSRKLLSSASSQRTVSGKSNELNLNTFQVSKKYLHSPKLWYRLLLCE